MPYTLIVAGTPITASWANTNTRDQVVNPFDNSVDRANASADPPEGLMTYLSDVDQVSVYSGTAHVPIPNTVIARAFRTTSSTATTTEIGVLQLRVGDLISQRIYRIQVGVTDFYSPVANDVVRCRIRYTTDGTDATVASTILPGSDMQHRLTGTGIDEQHVMLIDYVAGAGVDLSLMLTVGRSAGSGNVQILAAASAPIYYSVMCMGKNPGDTGVDI